MDWTTSIPVITSSVIALGAIGAGLWQAHMSNKLSEKRLEREREVDQTTWRRNVRSEPIFRFRTELAHIATKYEQLVQAAQRLHTRFGMTEEEARGAFEQEKKTFNEHLSNFAEASFMLDDPEII